jgi:hypothetical protein
LFLGHLLVDKAFKAQGEERYHKYIASREFEIKMREKSRTEEENYYELKKRFPKHLYESDAEESDYELTDRDLHP